LKKNQFLEPQPPQQLIHILPVAGASASSPVAAQDRGARFLDELSSHGAATASLVHVHTVDVSSGDVTAP
jgi:hypothetical protein